MTNPIDEMLAVARRARIARQLEEAKAAVNEMPEEAFLDAFESDCMVLGVGSVLSDDPEGDWLELQRIVSERAGAATPIRAVDQPRIDALEQAVASLTTQLGDREKQYQATIRNLERDRDGAFTDRNEARLQLQRSLGYIDRILEQERPREDPRQAAPIYPYHQASDERGPRLNSSAVPF